MKASKTQQEETRWASVPGFPHQEVSTDGQIRWLGSGTPCYLAANKRGRKQLGMVSDDGRNIWMFVARAVLLAFVGEPPTKDRNSACHRNDVPGDDRLENLYWGTQSENCRDSWRNGRRKKSVRGRSVAQTSSTPTPWPKDDRQPKDVEIEKLVAARIMSVMRSNMELAAYLGTRSSIEKWIETVAAGVRMVIPPDEPAAAPARTPQGAAAC